ncbi:MAG: endonuclease [Kiritimatiellaeota bacterium]|nr:endonuclease [Kiritimatiellota bacterium]
MLRPESLRGRGEYKSTPPAMRLLIYNIAYGARPPKSARGMLLTPLRTLRSSERHFARIVRFIEDQAPDIIGLVEVDVGSVRTRRTNQAAEIARALEHLPRPHYAPKYGTRRYPRYVPILRHQTNAILAREGIGTIAHHYLPRGFKRLVLEVGVNGLTVLLVHLPLRKRARQVQIAALADLVAAMAGPLILAGDFNVFGGHRELHELMQTTGLKTANIDHTPTFPSWKPKRELDFILHSPEIRVRRFHVLNEVRLSDHLPLVLDFTLAPSSHGA